MDKWHPRMVTTPDPELSKAALRKSLQEQRSRLAAGSTDVRAGSLALNAMEILREHNIQPKAIALFVSFGHEPPTDVLLTSLNSQGVEVLLPRVISEHTLEWRNYNDSWTEDFLGISAPSDSAVLADLTKVDAIFIPAIAASPDGRRLGRGAGFYDRALADLPRFDKGGPLRVAVIDQTGLLPAGAIPIEEHDQPIDAILIG